MSAILFVCTGNICRSPMAEGLFTARLSLLDGFGSWRIDSAGIYAQVGRAPDPLAILTAAKYDASIAHLRSRPFELDDFFNFQHIVAMDHGHRDYLFAVKPEAAESSIMMLEDRGGQPLEVADPYGNSARFYARIGRLIDEGVERLVARIGGSD